MYKKIVTVSQSIGRNFRFLNKLGFMMKLPTSRNPPPFSTRAWDRSCFKIPSTKMTLACLKLKIF